MQQWIVPSGEYHDQEHGQPPDLLHFSSGIFTSHSSPVDHQDPNGNRLLHLHTTAPDGSARHPQAFHNLLLSVFFRVTQQRPGSPTTAHLGGENENPHYLRFDSLSLVLFFRFYVGSCFLRLLYHSHDSASRRKRPVMLPSPSHIQISCRLWNQCTHQPLPLHEHNSIHHFNRHPVPKASNQVPLQRA